MGIAFSAPPEARNVMKALGVQASAAKLMKSATSSTELQRLAGSVLTLISGMPVTSELSDDKSGSDGVVNIVMPRPSRIYAPDKTMLKLSSGVVASGTDDWKF